MGKYATTVIALLIMVSITLTAITSPPSTVRAAWSGGKITINPNGSVTPSGAPLVTADNVTYYLTEDISWTSSGGIVIERGNIVLNGNGHTISGPGYGYGIYVKNVGNVTIENTTMKNFSYGIYLRYSSNNTISGNSISNNDWAGMRLVDSSNNTISGNNISSNNEEGIYLEDSSNNTISSNSISNNGAGMRLVDSSNNTISSNSISNNWGGIYLEDSSNNNSISGNVFVSDGLFVWNSYNNRVVNNSVNGKPLIYLEGVSNEVIDGGAGQVILVKCTNITVKNQNLTKTTVGIELEETSNSTISNNSISNNGAGIYLENSSNNSISGNNISSNNWAGIGLWGSSNNTIIGNEVIYNNKGIYVSHSSGNLIYLNDFVGNYQNVKASSSNDSWHSPVKITYGYGGGVFSNYLGNYWSDYSGSDGNNDGVGDTQYVIPGDNNDTYPLMKAVGNYSIPPPPIPMVGGELEVPPNSNHGEEITIISIITVIGATGAILTSINRKS